jgi:preprotein translocase subunit SecY
MTLLSSWRNLFRIPEARRRILWTLGLLVVFRIGSHVPLPGLNPAALRAFSEQASEAMGGLWSYLQLFSGGALGHLALFSMGIAPYITASIIVQLLSKVHPALEAIAKEGARGQRRLQQITRYVSLPVCLLQASVAVWNLFDVQVVPPLLTARSVPVALLLVAGLTAGAMALQWIGEQITERGVGNGASILIMAGIVSRMPALLGEMTRRVREGALGADAFVLILLLYVAAIVAMVFLSQAQRRIPLQHASHVRGRRLQLGGRNYLPIRILGAGVMPLIFASTALVVPELLGRLPGMDWLRRPFHEAGFVATVFQVAVILFFSYFWAYVFFRPSEIALQLRESGSFIPGLRPGEVTAAYLDGILTRITLCGGVVLAAIALLPGFLARGLGLHHLLDAFLGGSSLLIVVGVGLDLIQKFESWLLMHHYGGFLSRGGGNLK